MLVFKERKITMLWLAIGALLLSFIVNIALISRWSGRVEQTQRTHNDILRKNEEQHDYFYKEMREHKADDQKHFSDTDMHWNRREREWLNQRFEEMGERFDKVESMIALIRTKG
jgi:hypothetical protein